MIEIRVGKQIRGVKGGGGYNGQTSKCPTRVSKKRINDLKKRKRMKRGVHLLNDDRYGKVKMAKSMPFGEVTKSRAMTCLFFYW